MKTKKENKTKNCSRCGTAYGKKEKGVWTIKFPYWICKNCALKANENFGKAFKGDFKGAVSGISKQMFGKNNKDKLSNDVGEILKESKKREKARNKLLKKGFTNEEIDNGWRIMGWKK